MLAQVPSCTLPGQRVFCTAPDSRASHASRAGNQQLGVQDEPAIEVYALPGPGEYPLPPAVKHAEAPKEDHVRT